MSKRNYNTVKSVNDTLRDQVQALIAERNYAGRQTAITEHQLVAVTAERDALAAALDKVLNEFSALSPETYINVIPPAVLASRDARIRAEAFQERTSAYVKLNEKLLPLWVELYPNYAWTDPDTAIDFMGADIAILRVEKDRIRAEALAIVNRNADYLTIRNNVVAAYAQGVDDLVMFVTAEIKNGPSISTTMAEVAKGAV